MSNIKLFESKKIRSVWNETDQRWYFSVADVVEALTDSANVRDYLKKMRRRESELNANWGTICPPLELIAPDGKRRKTQCANAEGLLRIIQSIPSPKAEPFKLWLARVGYERLEEIENPELAAKRMREIYKAKGYSDQWIEKRVRGIEFWLARALQHLLGYTKWDNFLNVVSKAKTACEVSGHEVSDHFADVGKTIAMPKGAATKFNKMIKNILCQQPA